MKITKRSGRFGKIISMSLAAAAMVSMISAILSNYYNRTAKFEFKREIANKEIQHQIDSIFISLKEMEIKYNNLVRYDSLRYVQSLIVKPDSLKYNQFAIVKLRFMYFDLKKKLDKLSEQTFGLRQAINPLNPDEVLTIARLKDAISLVDSKQMKLESDIEKTIEDFRSSVRREIDSTSKATNWLFVVLIPLVLNLFYNMWKDFRESKSKQKEKADLV